MLVGIGVGVGIGIDVVGRVRVGIWGLGVFRELIEYSIFPFYSTLKIST